MLFITLKHDQESRLTINDLSLARMQPIEFPEKLSN